MYVFGEIDKSSTVIESNIVHYTHNLTTSSAGIQSYKIISGSWIALQTLASLSLYTTGNNG